MSDTAIYVTETQVRLACATDEELEGLLRSAARHSDPEVRTRVEALVVAERQARGRA